MIAMLWTAARALVYMLLFVGLWTWLALTAHGMDERLGAWLPSWLSGPGVVLGAVGLALCAWCIALFVVHGRGTPAPFDAPRAFVAVGSYRWVRNPMYLGFFLFLTGYALCAGSYPALGVAFLMLAMAHFFVLSYEEPTLERRFGDSYRAYRETTNRWIPRPR